MPALSDVSLGIGTESTWNTGVTPTRWYEITSDGLDFNVNKNVVQGAGMRVGSVVSREARRVIPTLDASGTMKMEVTTRGMGLLLEACLGTSVSTLVSGTTYQQNHSISASATTLPPRTLQTGVVDTTGTTNAVTYTGGAVSEFTFSLDNAGMAMLEVTWDFGNYTTVTAYTTPTYTASNNLFHFGHGATASMGIGGTFTAPTTTVLASTTTSVTNVRSFSITVNNNLAADRFNLGGAGRKSRQLAGDRTITGSIEAEYDANTLRDLFLNDTSVPVVLTLTSTEALSVGFAQFQVAAPAVRFNGETPKGSAGEIVTLSADFDVLDNLTAAQPLWISTRTADSAL
jgi:hypothetical protein